MQFTVEVPADKVGIDSCGLIDCGALQSFKQ